MQAYLVVAVAVALLARPASSQCIVTAAGAVNIEGGMATALSLNTPQAAQPDPTGTFALIADAGNHVIRKVLFSNSTMSTVAGQFRRSGFGGNRGAATSALLNGVSCLYPDGSSGYYFCDYGNNAVRRLFANGTVVAAFGVGGQPGSTGDGGPASLALLNGPAAMSGDGAGGFFVAEVFSNIVRQVCTRAQVLCRRWPSAQAARSPLIL